MTAQLKYLTISINCAINVGPKHRIYLIFQKMNQTNAPTEFHFSVAIASTQVVHLSSKISAIANQNIFHQ